MVEITSHNYEKEQKFVICEGINLSRIKLVAKIGPADVFVVVARTTSRKITTPVGPDKFITGKKFKKK